MERVIMVISLGIFGLFFWMGLSIIKNNRKKMINILFGIAYIFVACGFLLNFLHFLVESVYFPIIFVFRLEDLLIDFGWIMFTFGTYVVLNGEKFFMSKKKDLIFVFLLIIGLGYIFFPEIFYTNLDPLEKSAIFGFWQLSINLLLLILNEIYFYKAFESTNRGERNVFIFYMLGIFIFLLGRIFNIAVHIRWIEKDFGIVFDILYIIGALLLLFGTKRRNKELRNRLKRTKMNED